MADYIHYRLPSEVIDAQGRIHAVDVLTLRELLEIKRNIAACRENCGNDAEASAAIRRILSAHLPPGSESELEAYHWGKLMELTCFLAAIEQPAVPGKDYVDWYFAAALIMKEFGAYTLSMLLDMAMPEFMELYRLACAVQVDETLMVTARGTAAALNNDFRHLCDLRRALAVSKVSNRCCEEQPSREAIDEARKTAEELQRQWQSSEKLCVLADLLGTSNS